jgi:hypothetical protein
MPRNSAWPQSTSAAAPLRCKQAALSRLQTTTTNHAAELDNIYLFIYFVYICPAIELVLMCG